MKAIFGINKYLNFLIPNGYVASVWVEILRSVERLQDQGNKHWFVLFRDDGKWYKN